LFTGSSAPQTAHEHARLEQQAAESTSELTEVEVDEENGDDEDERLPDELPPSPSPIPPSPNSDVSSFTAPSAPLPASSHDPSIHVIHPSLQVPGVLGLANPLFTIIQLGVDRRLLVNRKRQLKMYRVWMQGKFQRTEADG
jgi:tRNAThr (cytosine32-N3)-methyltransferase